MTYRKTTNDIEPMEIDARNFALIAAASMGLGFGSAANYTFCSHEPNPNAKYTDSGKALSKRRKRRLRGKGQP